MVDEGALVVEVKRMRLRFAATCALCGAPLVVGTTADYYPVSKTVLRGLPDPTGPTDPAVRYPRQKRTRLSARTTALGTAGVSRPAQLKLDRSRSGRA